MFREDLNNIGYMLVGFAGSRRDSAWNKMKEESYERAGGRITGVELQESIVASIERLVQISKKYEEISLDDNKGMEYFIFGNSARTIYEWFTFYIANSVNESSGISTVMWINLIAETDVLVFLEDKWSKGHISPSPIKDGFSLYQYISSTINEDVSSNFVNVYNEEHDNIIRFLGSDRLIYKPLTREYQSTRNPGIQDLNFPYFIDEETIFKDSMKYSFFVMLDDKDFRELYSDVVVKYKSDRFWVLDCPSVRSVVITPNGVNNLIQDPRLLDSNAKHEALHAYFDARLETRHDLMRSGQYLLPRWTIEGLANFVSGRGREEDGFRERQLRTFEKFGLKEFDEIASNNDEYYEYYTLLMYFLLSAMTFSYHREKQIKLIKKDDESRMLEALILFRLSIFKTELPSNGDFRNTFIEDIVMKVFAGSEHDFRNLSFENLKVLFNENKEKIFKGYYEDNEVVIDLNKVSN